MSWVLFSICFTGRGQRKYKQFRHFITWLHCITGKLYVSIILESKVRLQFLETTSDIMWQSQLKVTGRSVSFFGLRRGGFGFIFPRIECVSEKGLSRLPHQNCGSLQLRPRPFGRLLLIWWLGGQPVGSVLEGLLCSRNTQVRNEMQGGATPPQERWLGLRWGCRRVRKAQHWHHSWERWILRVSGSPFGNFSEST